MKYRLNWFGQRVGEDLVFPAAVPGNIQKDYAAAKNWGDLNYGMNVLKYQEIEDDTWMYSAEYTYEKTGERIWFLSGGIDYEYEIFVNGSSVYAAEGTYAPVETDITEYLAEGLNKIEVKILPHPKRPGVPPSRTQADAVAKPPVAYGWDWHPRLLNSGIWNDAWLESRPLKQPKVQAPTYTLSEDFKTAYIHFEIEDADAFEITWTAPDGSCAYTGNEADITLENPVLWWCNGEGEQNLYTWTVQSGDFEKTGRTGFRNIELVMNEGTWGEPKGFPKSRSHPPITVCLNGRRIFAKGSNFVSPEVFPADSCRETYEPLVRLAKEANMNIFRCWGGSGMQKDAFFDLCDELGIMIWQEFPLACNEYKGTPHYLKVLEKEARYMVRHLRSHPCVVLWCGGNELFNSWSRMTDQSLPLRLLNRICYEEDMHTPFINTSPLSGMAHGGYTFVSDDQNGNIVEIYGEFNNAHNTAYTEFGASSIAPAEFLRTFIPEDELFPPQPGGTYELHHGFNSWHKETWLCLDTMKSYFGELTSLEDMCEKSAIMQCAAYQAIFEEARRQKPYCSMVINWCYDEPWKTAANNALLCYPAIPKPAYYAVRDSLRPVAPSARLYKFSYVSGEEFRAELWLLNDTQAQVSDAVHAYLEFNGKSIPVMDWNTPTTDVNRNVKGHVLQFTLPDTEEPTFFKLRLVSEKYGESSYTLYCRPQKKRVRPVVAALNT